MLGIGRVQKGALVMIEPPGEARVAGVFEIDDGVFVAIEKGGIEALGCLVNHTGIKEFGVRVDRARDKAAEEGSRGRAIETVVVIQNAFQHESTENLSACLNRSENASSIAAGCQASLETSLVSPR